MDERNIRRRCRGDFENGRTNENDGTGKRVQMKSFVNEWIGKCDLTDEEIRPMGISPSSAPPQSFRKDIASCVRKVNSKVSVFRPYRLGGHDSFCSIDNGTGRRRPRPMWCNVKNAVKVTTFHLARNREDYPFVDSFGTGSFP